MYMRATVLVCDLLYVWAVVMFTRMIQATRSTRTRVRLPPISLVGEHNTKVQEERISRWLFS